MSEIVASAAPPTVDPRLRELRRVAIVPALNEEHSIGRVIDELRSFDPGLDIVVVDDGSVDATSQVAADKGARVVDLPITPEKVLRAIPNLSSPPSTEGARPT